MATGVAAWSQTAASNATADANANWAEGMAPSQVNDSARAIMASVAKWRDDMSGTLNTTGSNTAYTVTTNQGFASLSALDGKSLALRFDKTNGASPTLSVDSLTAKPIQMDSTLAIATSTVRATSIHHLTYDNSAGVFILHNGHSITEAGRIAPHARSTAPPGWLLCDGTGYSRTTYADLFAIVSTTYGSSDGSTFKVPDLTGRVPAGKEASATRLTTAVGGVDGGTLGASGGNQGVALTQANLPSANLTTTISTSNASLNAAADVTGVAAAGGGGFKGAASTNGLIAGTVSLPALTGTTPLGGSDTSHANVQPTLIVNYVIKY